MSLRIVTLVFLLRLKSINDRQPARKQLNWDFYALMQQEFMSNYAGIKSLYLIIGKGLV